MRLPPRGRSPRRPPPVLGGSAKRIVVLKRNVRASLNGVVQACACRCPATEAKCRLDIRLRRNGRQLGRKKATVTGGKTVNVKLRLTRSARAKLARKGSLRVKAVIRATDSDHNVAITTTKLNLLAPGRR